MNLKYLRQAIKYAEKARGKCSPNPFVGAVIVNNGEVVGYGWTQAYGFDHAEVQAIKMAGDKTIDATLYVTLEPCCHHGKTPPCTDIIISSKIKKVVAGIQDPNPLVNGKGFAILQESGIEVQYGFFQEEISHQLEYYLTYATYNRPFILYKTAISWDGKYQAQDGSSKWITNSASRKYVHKLRGEVDVVLTGINTILADNPMLNVRYVRSSRQPVRVVLDSSLLIPLDSQIVCSSDKQKTILFYSNILTDSKDEHIKDKIERLRNKGLQLIPVSCINDSLNILEVLNHIAKMKYISILLESGSTLATSFMKLKLIDKCYFFYGNKIIGGMNSIFNELKVMNLNNAIQLKNIRVQRFDSDVLICGYPVYTNIEQYNSIGE